MCVKVKKIVGNKSNYIISKKFCSVGAVLTDLLNSTTDARFRASVRLCVCMYVCLGQPYVTIDLHGSRNNTNSLRRSFR